MEVDLLKILLLAGVIGLLYLLVRRASPPEDYPPTYDPAPSEFNEPQPRRVPVVGKEIPFPLDVNELSAELGGDFVRPHIRNYYFRSTDLVAGPADPQNFSDEFFVELEHPESGYIWTATFVVCTPVGVDHRMKSEREDFLFGEGMIIVKRFDLKTILRAVLTFYAEPNDPLRQATSPDLATSASEE
jgi:hypothetical protein